MAGKINTAGLEGTAVDLDSFFEEWPTTTQDRKKQRERREAYALQYDNMGL